MTIIPSPRGQKRARIEIIPLIDIMFFLLATFVMVSLSMVKNQGIPVRLPSAATGQPEERKDAATITVSATGQLYLDKEELSLDALAAKLAALKSANAELKIFINGDEDARLGLAIEVLDTTRQLGISKVAFETKKKPR
ncbi:MAG: biopolymer transporter ExbD [Verrucomicrobia bacterium]|jgi:biopolymer transport protein ExbD|nr:MAG: biopolymer transporter ExbD [Verrucomicrobiota bacterium]